MTSECKIYLCLGYQTVKRINKFGILLFQLEASGINGNALTMDNSVFLLSEALNAEEEEEEYYQSIACGVLTLGFVEACQIHAERRSKTQQ